jgi:hypothetical protein
MRGLSYKCTQAPWSEDNKIINDTCEVSEKFNTFFSTVADKIGEDIVYDPTKLINLLIKIASQLILFFAIFSVKNSYISNTKLWFHFNYLFKLLADANITHFKIFLFM